jgi:hypothetical protein
MRAAVAEVRVSDTAEVIALLTAVADDLKRAGSIESLQLSEGEPSISVELAATE